MAHSPSSSDVTCNRAGHHCVELAGLAEGRNERTPFLEEYLNFFCFLMPFLCCLYVWLCAV